MRYLIVRNLDQLLKLSINEAMEFVNTGQAKSKALQQIKYTLLLAEEKIAKHIESVIKSLVKISQTDIDNVERKIKEIVEIIGYHVRSDYYVPLILDMLRQEEFKNSNKNTIILLDLLSHMLLTSEHIEDHVNEIAKQISHYEIQFIDNDEGLLSIFEISRTLVKRLTEIEKNVTRIIFSIVINVQSTMTISADMRNKAIDCMNILAAKAGFSSVSDLHAQEVGPILEKIILEKEYVHWNKTSKDRFKFDTIVKNCHSEVSRFLPHVLIIFEFLIQPQNDLETRMDTLVLIDKVLNIDDLKDALQCVSEQLLRKVFLTAIKWKVGKPQIKIRKAGVINIITLIRKKIIKEEILKDCFKELFSHLKDCLNDDWAPELRLASCELVEEFLLATKDIISEELTEIYPVLLERLDDSQDPIRKKVTLAINVFFNCRNIKLSSSTFEYMINAIFIHLDDNSEEIRDSIYLSLRYAGKISPKEIINVAESNLKKMKYKERCKELIEFCQELLDEYKL